MRDLTGIKIVYYNTFYCNDFNLLKYYNSNKILQLSSMPNNERNTVCILLGKKFKRLNIFRRI